MAKKKMLKSLTFKEKVLLTILLVLGVLYGMLNFVLPKANQDLDNAKALFNQRLAQSDIINDEISHKATYTARIEALNENESRLRQKFPTSLDQDVILMKLLTFAHDASIQISLYSFAEIDSVNLSNSEETASLNDMNPVSATMDNIQEYQDGVGEDVTAYYDAALGLSSEDTEDAISLEDLINADGNAELTAKLGEMNANLLSQDVELSVKGSYQNLMHFLTYIENNSEAIYILNSTYNSTDDGILANLSLRFVGYYDNTVNGSESVEVPDEAGMSGDIFSEGAQQNVLTSSFGDVNFSLVLNNYQSNEQKIYMMQKGADNSIIYVADNAVAQLSLTLKKVEQGIQYSYTLAGKTYTGLMDVPGDQQLNFNVISTKRLDGTDRVSALVSIDNQTDYTLNVNVVNDDASNPRFVVNTLKGKVKVN